ncbi:phage tail protein [Henriciella aquimarina]|uniref:phage tail protein n=1 Tax=Henriciella aquimarina TaxID=545261 RepID=UPI000A055BF3|nr:phage tail protein [Henriciella aquimarina]
MTRQARWFLDITLDDETLRWWSGTGSVSFDGNTYTGLGTRWTPPESLKRKSSLKSEKLELEFDSSRQSDNSDPIGSLLDEKWRNRAVRLRRLAWDAGDSPDDGDVLEDERGRIRNLSDALKKDDPAIITMEIESGALAYLERRMETRSPAGQKAVFAGDKGFDLIAQLEGATLPWRTKHKKAGTVRVELQEEYEPAPRELAFGRFATSGTFVAAFTGGQQRKYFQRVFALADHRINKLDKVWINGYLARNSALSHGVRTLVYLEGNNEQRCWVTFYDGRPDQTADSYLVGSASTWTSSHRLRGVAYVIVEHLWDSDLPESFDYRFSGEGALLYDRRKDTTAGGSGSHRWDDPATWEYSTNAMVAADHYRSGIRITSGSSAMWFGVGEPVDAVPYAEFESLADHCDELVALKGGGTQKRYEVNGILSADDDHAKNLQKIADQMAARAIDQGGRISIRPPIERTPVITLTDGDTIRDSESIADPGGRIDDMVNTLSGRFINPANDYKKDDYPEVSISAYVADDNGEISDTLDLDMEISGERSQRIAKLKIEDSRRIFELEETYGVKARVIAPGEWFVRESVIRGFPGGKTFICEEVERFLDGSIRVMACEVDPDQLVWDEETAVDLSVPPAFPQTALPIVQVPSVSLTAVELGSSNVTPGVRLTQSLPTDLTEVLAEVIEVEFGVSDGSGGISGQPQYVRFDALRASLTLAGFLPSTVYAFRFRGIDGRRGSDWSSFQTVTTTANATATSAGVVAWSGVTGSGKPEDNADVTFYNTAAAIIGQDWGATASEGDASNDVVRQEAAPLNRLPEQYAMPHQASRPALYTPQGNVRTTDTSRAHAVLRGLSAIPVESDETQPYFFIRLTSGSGRTNMVLPDGRFAYKILVSTFSSVTSITVRLRDASNVSRYSFTFARTAATQLIEGYFDVSGASAGTNEFYLDLSFGLSGTVYSQAWYHYAYIAQIPTTQSALGPLPAIDYKLLGIEDDADVTGDHVAAGFQGQGALATLNELGPAYLAVPSLAAITGTIGLLRTATSGARTEIEDNQIRVYDASGTLRVRMGVW